MEEQLAPVSAPAKPPKSPPMAFEMTSNDSLYAPVQHNSASKMPHFYSPEYVYSPGTRQTRDCEVSDPLQKELQTQVKKQADALRLQHQAFAVERECWDLERDRLYRRVEALEGLLKAANGHSPARSPTVSPYSDNLYTSSQHRSSSATNASRLSSIAEDDSTGPRSRRRTNSFLKRELAPSHIDIPAEPTISFVDGNVETVAASEGMSLPPELPGAPPASRKVLSPPPPQYVEHAGHTPLRVPHRPIFRHSPSASVMSEPELDTPTQANTEANLALSREQSADDEDLALKGPLNMPELPNSPGDQNFTMDMLTARLRQIEEHPEDNEPFALHARSNRRDSIPDGGTPITEQAKSPSKPLETITEDTKRDSPAHASASGSSIRSPAPSESSQHNTEEPDRGIKLRKRPSCNFGAPFGQLGPRDAGFKKF